MRKIVVIFLIMLLSSLLWAGRDEVLSKVDQLLGRAQFSEALSLLSQSIREHAADPPRQALYIKGIEIYKQEVKEDKNDRIK